MNEQGGLDILINNAGGQFPQPAIDFSPNGWRAVIDKNLNGTWFMMQAAAQRWRDAKKPGNIASEGMKVYPQEAVNEFPHSNPMQRFGSAWGFRLGYCTGLRLSGK